jgi:2,4-dienoyl-CoA reductase-like NADH-dependent reductase (Old Yellow Enzyme family)
MSESAVEESFEFAAVGRALIREPDLLRRMQAGETTTSLCNQCNECFAEMECDGGTRCVFHPEIRSEEA